jgi:hypothetical protein
MVITYNHDLKLEVAGHGQCLLVEVASDRDVPGLGEHWLLKATDTKLAEDEQLGQ